MASTSIDDIKPTAIYVPFLTEQIFKETYERTPTDVESTYWKKRFRTDKDSVYKLRRAMAWHQAKGSFGPPISASISASANLIQKVNALFRSVYDGRNPTVSENQYWQSRISDKPTEQALQGAMAYHRLHNIQH